MEGIRREKLLELLIDLRQGRNVLHKLFVIDEVIALAAAGAPIVDPPPGPEPKECEQGPKRTCPRCRWLLAHERRDPPPVGTGENGHPTTEHDAQHVAFVRRMDAIENRLAALEGGGY